MRQKLNFSLAMPTDSCDATQELRRVQFLGATANGLIRRRTHEPGGLFDECNYGPGIRELKHRYRVNTALNQVLPLADRGFSIPLSTGNPLFDAALTEKLQTSASLTEVEHLQRSWELCRRATDEELRVLADHVDGLLNNFKLLLALACWDRGDAALARQFISRLPWHWRLAFPIAVLKPSAHFLTGWRRNTRFRLVNEPRHPELRAVFGELIDAAPERVLLKYRSTVKEAAALQRYRFEGDKQRAVHDLCFRNERTGESTGVLATYFDSRDALANGNSGELAGVLGRSEYSIPLTSLMGLFGNAGVNLHDDRIAGIAELRTQTIRCATAVECLLRLNEWSSWLTPEHVDQLSEKVTSQILGGHVQVPFFRIIAAFNAVPQDLRRQLVQPLLRPLMEAFGRQVVDLLPPPGPITFVMPMNVFRISSFLLYAVTANITDTRMLLLDPDRTDFDPGLELDEVLDHLADDPDEMVRWLLRRFGSKFVDRVTRVYTYDRAALARVLDTLDPQAPLVIDLPFFADVSLLTSLARFDRIFNLGPAMGAPGELNISPRYYRTFSYETPGMSFAGWRRGGDSSARSFTETLDRLRWFEQLGHHAQLKVLTP